MTASFKSMQRDGVVKRADARRMRWEDLHIEPGFNPEGRTDVDSEDNQSLLNHIMNGGMLPALEVRPREDGGAWIVEGHRRWTMIGVADKAGAPLRDRDGELWIDIVPFEGNDIERHYRVVTSAERLELTPLQLAEQFAKLSRFKQTASDIAERLKPKRTRQHVERLLILASGNHDVKELVKSGAVSAEVAIDAIRKHGEQAGEFLSAKHVEAKAQGKSKVTAGVVNGKALPKKVVQSIVEELDVFMGALPNSARERLASIEDAVKRGDLPEGQEVSVPASALLSLVAEFSNVTAAREKQQQRQRDRAAKAAQQEIAGA
ncbi:ParB/RepB/Spo0J family partition protein [Bradyrhizobium sp.]|uniref:ParB/RepB/Spo0J family partition protein n=1 Tax=Bradyrhizobium sp. TaxID=376 RepID=UPI0039E43F6D